MLRYEVWWYADVPDRLMAAGLTVKKAAQHISRHSRKVSAAGALARTLPLFILLIYLWVQCCELTPPVKSLDSTVSFFFSLLSTLWINTQRLHRRFTNTRKILLVIGWVGGEEFEYVGVFLMSDGRIEWELTGGLRESVCRPPTHTHTCK